MSIYARGHSTESVLLHILVVFTDDIHHFHNTLLFNPLRIEKYKKILHESDFAFNNEIMVMTKGRETIFQYDVAPLNHEAFMGVVGNYDALISLDRYASLWSEYNAYVVERSLLTLRMSEPDEWEKEDKKHYRGLYHLKCNDTISYKRCHVSIGERNRDLAGDLVVNGEGYHSLGLVINTGSSQNLLPYNLYLYWSKLKRKDLFIGGNAERHLLHLNTQFEYGINHESTDIVLGIDFLMFFQRVEFCGEAGHYKAWYSHIYDDNDGHEFQNFVMFFFEVVLLSVFFYWSTSPNYRILRYFLKGAYYFDFPFRMLWWEFCMIIIGLILWLLVFLFTDGVNPSGSLSNTEKRNLLFVLFSGFHMGLSLIYLIIQHPLVRDAYRYYYSYWLYLTVSLPSDRNYDSIIRRINSPTRSVEVAYVIVRNVILQNLIASNLLLVLNYLGEEKTAYLWLMVFVSIVLTYYYVKFIATGVIYIHYVNRSGSSWRSLWRKSSSMIMVVGLCSAVFIAYLISSLFLVFYPLYQEINSAYCSIVLWALIMIPLCAVFVFAFSVVFLPVVARYLSVLSTPTEKEEKIN